MAKISVITDDDELIETIDLNDYNLSKPIAKSFFQGTLYEAIERAQRIEKDSK